MNAFLVINPGIIIGKAKTKKYNCKINGVPLINQVKAEIIGRIKFIFDKARSNKANGIENKSVIKKTPKVILNPSRI